MPHHSDRRWRQSQDAAQDATCPILASGIQVATTNKFASNTEVASLATALHTLDTQCEIKGLAMQAQLDAREA
jgi:hypothetical protein